MRRFHATSTRREVVLATLTGGLIAGVTVTSGQPAIGFRALTTGTPAASPVAPVETFSVRTVGLRFEPAQIFIPARTPARLLVTNDSATIHDLVIPSLGRRTRRLRPSESDDLVLNLEPSVYEFNCSIQSHWQAGMQGEIIVEDLAANG